MSCYLMRFAHLNVISEVNLVVLQFNLRRNSSMAVDSLLAILVIAIRLYST